MGAEPKTLPADTGGGAGAGAGTGAGDDEREQAGRALGLALKGAIAAVRRLRGRDTQRSGEIAHAQYALLFELDERGELAAGELAAAAALTPATVTGMLDHLADAGLVVRTRSDHDRRIVVSRLTAAGRASIATRRARVMPAWNTALAEFDASELLVATAVLERVREFFETLDESPPPKPPPA